MSRVKRVATGEEIVINRDDDDIEKGTALDEEKQREDEGDSGTLAMFGAPANKSSSQASSGERDHSSDGSEAGPSSASEEQDETRKMPHHVLTETERENDEHPPENVLGDAPTDRDSHTDAGVGEATPHHHLAKIKTTDSAREERFCATGETREWQEGHQVSTSLSSSD